MTDSDVEAIINDMLAAHQVFTFSVSLGMAIFMIIVGIVYKSAMLATFSVFLLLSLIWLFQNSPNQSVERTNHKENGQQ